MSRREFLAVGTLTVCAFLVGYIWPGSEAKAAHAVPNSCPKYECKTVHALWLGNQLPSVQAWVVVNGTQNSDQAVVDLFTPNSVEKKQPGPNGQCDLVS